MEEFINRFKGTVTMETIVILVIVLLLIIFLSIFIKSMRLKKARNEYTEFENRYNTLKGVPLSFKLNKAHAIAKVNADQADEIEKYQKDFDDTQEMLKDFSIALAEIDDSIYSKKVARSNELLGHIASICESCEGAVRDLEKNLDKVLEQEKTQRDNINGLKERFRGDKKRLFDNRSSYHQSLEYLDGVVTDIENMFSVFEEWMFASEFNKAADKQNEIRQSIENFEDDLDKLPGYYETAKVTLPGAIDELEYLFTSSKNRGVYLGHIDFARRIQVIKELNSNILGKLSVSNIGGISRDIDSCEERIVELKEQIDKENNAFDNLHVKAANLFERIKNLNLQLQNIKDTYTKVYERFGFENWNSKINLLDEKMDALNEQRFRLEKLIEDNSVPYSTLLLSAEELEVDTKQMETTASELKQKLETACSDEERAKKQLVKLQLVVNEIRIKIGNNRLPSVSEKYDEDIIKANVFIKDVKETLATTPLNVDNLNATLQKAIDYIYTLYNDVNNLVGMANMVENAIMFGNKYRSEFPEVDSELTRAELCFSNGQYTKALKIAIAIIEKLHPGAYENLIRKEVKIGEANAA